MEQENEKNGSCSENLNNSKYKKGLASYASLAGQIFAAAWIAVWSGIKFAKDLQAASIQDFIFSGFAVAACFVPVFFNMIMDKIRGISCGISSSD